MVPLSRFLLLFVVCFVFFSCEKEHVINRGMYYWKSGSRNLENSEANFLIANKIQYCYVKFFEVINPRKRSARKSKSNIFDNEKEGKKTNNYFLKK